MRIGAVELIERFRRWSNRRAIRRALARMAPDPIPLSGDRVYARDYFQCFLDIKARGVFGNPLDAYGGITHEEDGIFYGWWWSGDQRGKGYDVAIPDRWLGKWDVTVRHYFKQMQIDYAGPVELAFTPIDIRSRMFFWWDTLSQKTYNQQVLPRDGRFEVLRDIFDRTLTDEDYRVDWIRYVQAKFGPRVHAHPQSDEMHKYYELVLDSLVETGDLDRSDLGLTLTAKGVATLASAEEENRRHQDARKHNQMLLLLTTALVLVGIGQIATGYFLNP